MVLHTAINKSTPNNQVSLYHQFGILLNFIIVFIVYLADEEACKKYLLPPWSSQMSK